MEATEITSPKLKKNRNLVSLSDLHSNEFGRDNGEPMATIHRLHPGAVLSGGDTMVRKGRRDIKTPLKLFRQLAVSHPAYCGSGSHENRIVWEHSLYGDPYEGYRDTMTAMGVHYLESSFVFLGGDLRTTGLGLSPHFHRKALCQKALLMSGGYMERKLGEGPSACKEEPLTILLVHFPLCSDSYVRQGADLTLAGHSYRGTIRIPRLGGVMAPQYQLFSPWRTRDFEQNGKRTIVSRGLGVHSTNIRLNNRPQLVLIRLRRARRA